MMSPLKVFLGISTVALSVFAGSVQAITNSNSCVFAHATVTKNTGLGNQTTGHVADDCAGFFDGTGGEVNFDEGELNTPQLLPTPPNPADTPNPLYDSKLDKPWVPGAFEKDGWDEISRFNFGQGNVGIGLGLDVTAPACAGGVCLINWTTTTALNGEWLVKVKQSTQVVLYRFANLSQTKSGQINLVGFDNNQAFSHLALISGTGTPEEDIPAPATLLLMGVGLASIGVFRRRRRAA